jgi:hypothetical protein
MSDCLEMRLLIDRIAESEGTPEEALALGRHLPGCTFCRILLAKAQRLNEMVDELGEPLEVDETFLKDIMDSLPDGPPQETVPSGVSRYRGHLRIVKLLVTMSPLGLLGAGNSLFIGYPGQFNRILDSSTVLPPEGGPGLTGSIRAILEITLAVAGKLGITTGDLTSARPVIAFGSVLSEAWPTVVALAGTGLLALALFRPARKLFLRNC